jgi:hypothetical protein
MNSNLVFVDSAPSDEVGYLRIAIFQFQQRQTPCAEASRLASRDGRFAAGKSLRYSPWKCGRRSDR